MFDLDNPSFLGGRVQFTAVEAREIKTIVSVRIHVECAIQQDKRFKAVIYFCKKLNIRCLTEF